jgi:hypothetical protein
LAGTNTQAAQLRRVRRSRYRDARTHEALGNFEEALRLLRSDPADAPQRHGNLLRAKRLEAQAAEKPAVAE